MANANFFRNDRLAQGSREWLDWRRGVLGASDAAAVMSQNPWKSRNYLLQEKLGRRAEFTGNAATREGQRLEAPARKAIAAEFGVQLAPTIIQSSSIPYLAASLDAIDGKNQIIFEIKCGQKAYEHVEKRLDLPSYYYAQVQHMLMVSELTHMYFSVFRPDRPLITLQVDRDETYIDELRAESIAFANDLIKAGHSLQREFVGVPVR